MCSTGEGEERGSLFVFTGDPGETKRSGVRIKVVEYWVSFKFWEFFSN